VLTIPNMLQQFVPSCKNATSSLPEIKEKVKMTVFEMAVFYPLFPHIGLYVYEMSICLTFQVPVDWFRPPAVYGRTSLPSYSQHSPCQGVQMGDCFTLG